MIKVWGKTLKRNRIMLSHTIESEEIFCEDIVLNAMYQICLKFDIPRPIVLNKHLNDIREFLTVRFLPDDFIEKVDFDKFEIEVYIEKKNKKDN